ncbi:MAG: Inosine-5'-monophosphate dehydrogenase [Methanocella sp. PtaU1.Bin125]|nr:MAG: Inosine-5'-monophosphate dehydrogenase [Methanocella sp. PtaU1.Bin125]
MSINPLTVDVDEFVTHAREIMRENNVQSLPAVKGGRYEGMVTMQDIINVTSTKSNVTLKGYVRWEASTVTPSTSLAKAARDILRTDEGRMPVLNENGRVVGVLSIIDIFKGIGDLDLPDVPVSQVMTRKVIVCEPRDEISRVWRNMTAFGIFGFPVVRPDQEVVGMITREDVTRRGYVRFERESEFMKKPPSTVQMIMSTPAITVDETDGTRKAARIFMERQIGRLPVVKNNRLTGIVDRYDILSLCRRLVAVE